jgi:hypothetical protein
MSQIFALMVLEQITIVGQCHNTFKIGNFEFKSLYLESTAPSLILKKVFHQTCISLIGDAQQNKLRTGL